MTFPIAFAKFKYLPQIPFAAANFEYISEDYLAKRSDKLLEAITQGINKKETQLLEVDWHKVNKNSSSLLESEFTIIDIPSAVMVEKSIVYDVNKVEASSKNIIMLGKIDEDIPIITLSSSKSIVNKEGTVIENALNSKNMLNADNLKRMELHRENSSLAREDYSNIILVNPISLLNDSRIMNFDKYETIKALTRSNLQLLDLCITKWVDSMRDRNLGEVINIRYLNRSCDQLLNVKINSNNMLRVIDHNLDKDNSLNFYEKDTLRKMSMNFMESLLDIEAEKNLSQYKVMRLLDVNLNKDVSKNSSGTGLNKMIFDGISKNIDFKFYDKEEEINLVKYEGGVLNAQVNIRPIVKSIKNSLKRDIKVSITKEKEIGLIKQENTPIYKELQFGLIKFWGIITEAVKKGLYKLDPIKISNIYETRFLEVTKRWWVVTATGPTDQLILPLIDYPYEQTPICRINKHPITGSLYINNNDYNWGNYDMPVSIEVMEEMLNIVTMIWHHAASQFACANGQETMEFIMELLKDWIDLPDTNSKMQRKGVLEHYLRCYRWIRWEAEKVWFKAKDEPKYNGIKYGGMLVANLIEYMKSHHFNIVPIYKGVAMMDYMRVTVLNPDPQGELIKPLDKLKGRRKYLIETQNFEKNSRR